jgi:hypothetical protein
LTAVGVEVVPGDVTDEESIAGAAKGVDSIESPAPTADPTGGQGDAPAGKPAPPLTRKTGMAVRPLGRRLDHAPGRRGWRCACCVASPTTRPPTRPAADRACRPPYTKPGAPPGATADKYAVDPGS